MGEQVSKERGVEPEEIIEFVCEGNPVGSIKKKKNVINFFDLVFKSKFGKFNKQRKEKKGLFVKTAKTSFANSDYPLLHTLA